MVSESLQFWQLVVFGIGVLSALFSCGAAVISYQNARKPASVELQSTVDECVTLIEKLLKDQRREKMRNVRNSARDTGDIETASIGGGVLDAQQQQPSPADYATAKAALRARARAAGRI